MIYQRFLSGLFLGAAASIDLKCRKVYIQLAAGYFLLALSGHLLHREQGIIFYLTGILPGLFCLTVSWISREGRLLASPGQSFWYRQPFSLRRCSPFSFFLLERRTGKLSFHFSLSFFWPTCSGKFFPGWDLAHFDINPSGFDENNLGGRYMHSEKYIKNLKGSLRVEACFVVSLTVLSMSMTGLSFRDSYVK